MRPRARSAAGPPLLAWHLGVPNGPETEATLSRAAMNLCAHGLFSSPAVGEVLARKPEEQP